MIKPQAPCEGSRNGFRCRRVREAFMQILETPPIAFADRILTKIEFDFFDLPSERKRRLIGVGSEKRRTRRRIRSICQNRLGLVLRRSGVYPGKPPGFHPEGLYAVPTGLLRFSFADPALPCRATTMPSLRDWLRFTTELWGARPIVRGGLLATRGIHGPSPKLS
jgi:hypothetical protein